MTKLTLLTSLFILSVFTTLGSVYGLLDVIGFLSPRRFNLEETVAWLIFLTLSTLTFFSSAVAIKVLLRK